MESAFGAGVEEFHEVGLQAHQVNLRFRVAEAGVEFENLWAGFCEHDSGVEETAKVDAFGGATFEPWTENGAAGFRELGLGEKRRWRICAHATGVEALIIVEGAFVVLGSWKEFGGLAVANGVEGNLGAFEKFLDDDAGAGFAKGFLQEDFVDGAI